MQKEGQADFPVILGPSKSEDLYGGIFYAARVAGRRPYRYECTFWNSF